MAFRAARILLLMRVFMVALVGGVGGLSAAADPLHYFYFDEQRPIELNPELVAIHLNGTTVAEFMQDPAEGVAVETVRAHAIGSWAIVTRSPQDTIDDLLARLRIDPRVSFSTPVFRDHFGEPLIVTPHILVRFHDDIPHERALDLIEACGAGDIVDHDWGGLRNAFRIRSTEIDGLETLRCANELAELPETLFAEPDFIFSGRGGLFPNDPAFTAGDLWGLHNTGQGAGVANVDLDAPEAWDIQTGDPSVIVVVIDTGVQHDHPDLNLIPGADFTSDFSSHPGGPVNSFDNHGTPVAGCISAVFNNNLGVAGIAPNCRVASARPFISSNPNGNWTTQVSWTVTALEWAYSVAGSRITNNSNGYGFTSSSIANKYASTLQDGMIHFASAGNDAVTTPGYPANLPSVHAISSIDSDGDLSSFSNSGDIAFAAPGAAILTTDRTGPDGWTTTDYTYAWGTSFASPYAAGVAALLRSQDPFSSPEEVAASIGETAKQLGSQNDFGAGLPSAYDALLHLTNCLNVPDLNGDGEVKEVDVAILLAAWGPAEPDQPEDLNDDGFVNGADLAMLLARWGNCLGI